MLLPILIWTPVNTRNRQVHFRPPRYIDKIRVVDVFLTALRYTDSRIIWRLWYVPLVFVLPQLSEPVCNTSGMKIDIAKPNDVVAFF